jgi:hypothetical protein
MRFIDNTKIKVYHEKNGGTSMKKITFLVIILTLATGLFAFDKKLVGTWGLNKDGEKTEFIRFYNNNEIVLLNVLLRQEDMEEIDDTIYIDNYGGEDSFFIQYYQLTPNKLLFILQNLDDDSKSMVLILSRL